MVDVQTLNGQATAIIAVSSVLSVLALTAVILRFLARNYKAGKYFLDDYLIVFGLILTLGVTINNIVGASLAGIGEHEDFLTSGPAKGFPLAKQLERQGKVMFSLQILHTCAMPVIKASVLAFYARIFPTKRFKRAIYVALAFVFGWWISIFFVTIFQCHPISHNWGTDPADLRGCLAGVNDFYEAAAFLNMISDVVVLALPVTVVARLKMSIINKVIILGIFLTGALVVVAGIGRTVAYFKDNYNGNYDFSYWYYSLVIWSSVEPTLGVISACLPTLRPIFAGLSPESLIGSALSLHSLRGNSTVNGERSPVEDYQRLSTAFGSPGLNSRSRGGSPFDRLPDPNASSRENHIVALELEERKNMQKDMPAKGIKVQEDLDQRVVHATTHEIV